MARFLSRALQTHLHWKERLLDAVHGGEIPNRRTACSDDCCELGKWLHGEGQALRGHAGFRELLEGHRRFHASVGRVLALVDAQKLTEAEGEIMTGAFAQHSKDVIAGIKRLKAAALTTG